MARARDGCHHRLDHRRRPDRGRRLLPSREGVVAFAAQARVLDHWPVSESRLICDLGGEALVSLAYEGGETVRFGNDPYHREFPLRGHAFTIGAEAVARRPFAEPVPEPRLAAARLAWIDLPVEALHRRLMLVAGACELLDGLTRPHLIDAAEDAPRARLALGHRRLRRPLRAAGRAAAHLAAAAAQGGAGRARRYPARQRCPRRPSAHRHAARPAAALPAAGRDRAHRPCAYRSRLALALCRDPPQGAAHLPHSAVADGGLERISSSPASASTSRPRNITPDREDDPALFEKIVARVRRGVGTSAAWVRPTPTCRQARSGARSPRPALFRQQLASAASAGCPTARFSGGLPQLLKQNSFFTIKVNWSETNKFPRLFWWEGSTAAACSRTPSRTPGRATTAR